MEYVIIGASAAGINGAKTLREIDKDCNITVVSKDDKVYSRCMLHHVIGGHRSIEDISFIQPDFFSENNIKWLSGVSVTSIDVENKAINTEAGANIPYDKLMIASGASSFLPPIKGIGDAKEGLAVLRDIEDAIDIRDKSKDIERAVVIGAGLVGIDGTVGLLEQGVEVHLMEMADRILPLQLDRKSSSLYEKKLEDNNAKIYTSVRVNEIVLDGDKVKGVSLGDGRIIDADLVVVAAGVRPNMDFIDEYIDSDRRGIIVNEFCETSQEDVYAAGDVCGRAPIWPIAVKQGISAAYNMAGESKDFHDEFASINSMNFFNIPTVSIGNPFDEDGDYVDIYNYNGVYKKIVTRDGLIKGAILQGDISYCGVLTQLIKNRINVSELNKDVFDIGYGDFYKEDESGRFSY